MSHRNARTTLHGRMLIVQRLEALSGQDRLRSDDGTWSVNSSLMLDSSAELSEPESQTRSRCSDSPSTPSMVFSTSESGRGTGMVLLPQRVALVIELQR